MAIVFTTDITKSSDLLFLELFPFFQRGQELKGQTISRFLPRKIAEERLLSFSSKLRQIQPSVRGGIGCHATDIIRGLSLHLSFLPPLY